MLEKCQSLQMMEIQGPKISIAEEFNGQCAWMQEIFQETEKYWSEIMNVRLTSVGD